jgi:hypothetical protein
MNDLNKKTDFDKCWEEVFQEAEMTPSDDVWNKIDSALSKEEAGYFKKRAFMFKLLAAASITFALAMGTFSLNYYLQKDNSSEVTQSGDSGLLQNDSGNPDVIAQDLSQNAESAIGESPVTNGATTLTKDQIKSNSGPDQGANLTATEPTNNKSGNAGESMDDLSQLPLATASLQDQHGVAESNEGGSGLHLANFDEMTALGIDAEGSKDMLYQIDHIYMIPIMPMGVSRMKKEKETGVLMASLDFSAGSFDPNFQQGGGSFAGPNASGFSDSRTELAAFNTANKSFLAVRSSGQETKPEMTYSYGANVGFRLSNRFLIQTGFAYRKANTTTTTTGYIENHESNTRIPIVASYQYQLDPINSVNLTEKTDLSNQYEFAAIPIRAGYVVLDRKINVTLLAGVSSEFFVSNRIVDESDFLQTLSSSDAADSPYKSVYFNGSLGTMVGYTFAKNYMVTLEPSYRMAISSFTKDSFYLNSFPSSFMLSFGVAYNFR